MRYGRAVAPQTQSERAELTAFAEAAAERLLGPEQTQALADLDARREALHATLERCLAGPEASESDTAAAGRLASALWRYWAIRGDLDLGRGWIGRCLALDSPPGSALDPALRAQLLAGGGNLAYQQGDFAATLTLGEEALTLWRRLDAPLGIATALHGLGSAHQRLGRLPEARDALAEAVAINRASANDVGLAATLRALGSVHQEFGDLPAARASLEESLARRERHGDQAGMAAVLHTLGETCVAMGDFLAARLMHEKALVTRRRLGDRWGEAHSLEALARLARHDGEDAEAARLDAEAAALKHALGDRS
jgi:tetratricopeptide (TPR) repeat protein